MQRRASVWISSYGGHLQRHTNASDLRPSAIFDAFCSTYIKQPRFHPLEAILPTTVIAYLVSMVWTATGWASTVEYFTQATLYTYLHERLRLEDRKSILQLFLPPAGEHNTVIRAWWTPHSLKLEQRVNLLDYDNVHQPPHRRCATFDGPENLSELKTLPNQASPAAKSKAREPGTKSGPRRTSPMRAGDGGTPDALTCRPWGMMRMRGRGRSQRRGADTLEPRRWRAIPLRRARQGPLASTGRHWPESREAGIARGQEFWKKEGDDGGRWVWGDGQSAAARRRAGREDGTQGGEGVLQEASEGAGDGGWGSRSSCRALWASAGRGPRGRMGGRGRTVVMDGVMGGGASAAGGREGGREGGWDGEWVGVLQEASEGDAGRREGRGGVVGARAARSPDGAKARRGGREEGWDGGVGGDGGLEIVRRAPL